jgi:NAD(P)-dependent dehydrogenase (short-subunit alcohol dehydrogenase family)
MTLDGSTGQIGIMSSMASFAPLGAACECVLFLCRPLLLGFICCCCLHVCLNGLVDVECSMVIHKFHRYHASKAAVRYFAEGLRTLLRHDNVGVTAICPGFVRSAMTEERRQQVHSMSYLSSHFFFPAPWSIVSYFTLHLRRGRSICRIWSCRVLWTIRQKPPKL